MVELDLRQIPPSQRHTLIFDEWDALKPGETLKIINDHDPKPLHYQFEAEYTSQYEWEYDLQGPADWVVRITKEGVGANGVGGAGPRAGGVTTTPGG